MNWLPPTSGKGANPWHGILAIIGITLFCALQAYPVMAWATASKMGGLLFAWLLTVGAAIFIQYRYEEWQYDTWEGNYESEAAFLADSKDDWKWFWFVGVGPSPITSALLTHLVWGLTG